MIIVIQFGSMLTCKLEMMAGQKQAWPTIFLNCSLWTDGAPALSQIVDRITE
jgi:hypothetical protein